MTSTTERRHHSPLARLPISRAVLTHHSLPWPTECESTAIVKYRGLDDLLIAGERSAVLHPRSVGVATCALCAGLW